MSSKCAKQKSSPLRVHGLSCQNNLGLDGFLTGQREIHILYIQL